MLHAAFIWLTSLGFLLLSPSAGGRQDHSYKLALRFSVTETSDFTFDLGRDLIVKATRAVNAHGAHIGWDLAVHDRRIAMSANFFYDCLCGHGPRVNDLYVADAPRSRNARGAIPRADFLACDPRRADNPCRISAPVIWRPDTP